ncbi:hypothetical protein B0H14DRAFT_3424001 [Mycena olivaceomarginata]|nr:hypothetical protein B0H14DRAFT_3424001 [Mycena olivaceomarginata]
MAELKALLTCLPDTVLEIQTSSSGVVRVTQKSKSKSLAKVATGRPKQLKQMTADEMELDGVEMISLEVEPDIQPDALEQGNDLDGSEASQSELGNLDVDGEAQQQSKIVVSSHIRTFSRPSSPLLTTEATAFHSSIFTGGI